MTSLPGPRVFLVGAGPGDPGLITRRGLELLRSCDVVLYDRLVDPRLVDEVPEHADRVFVGKRAGASSLPQAAIDALVVEHARAGKRVVRLKGGDPFVFGRGADEAQALAAAGISFEIVPGVTSAVAVPAYAGIPVTHSGISSSFAVLTAHESADRPGAEERWDSVARGAGTLVLMMGVSGLPDAMKRLIEVGRSPEEPAAIIERGSTRDQRTIVGTLATIADEARAAQVEAPAIVVVGPVVRLREALAWYEARPLFERRIVVTRARHQAGGLATALEEQGAEVIVAPTISIEDPPSWEDVDAALARLGDARYEWVVFSSVNAVERLWSRLEALGHDARIFGTVKLAAVGPATEGALAKRGLRADLVPETFSAAALMAMLGGGQGRVLMPSPADPTEGVAEALQASGWKVDQVVAYVTSAEGVDAVPAVRDGDFDAITFASGSACRGFVQAYGKPDELGLGQGSPTEKVVACLGPSTASVAQELGFRVDLVPEEHTAVGLAADLATLLTAAPGLKPK